MALAEVVKLHERPPLTDIANRFRVLADQIESGEISASAAFVVFPVDGDWPKVYGFGDVTGAFDPIVQFEMAKHWLVANLVQRG